MKKKIAIFKTSHDDSVPCKEGLVPHGYVQTTEWQDVDFILLPQKEIDDDSLIILKEKVDKAKSEYDLLHNQYNETVDAKTKAIP